MTESTPPAGGLCAEVDRAIPRRRIHRLPQMLRSEAATPGLHLPRLWPPWKPGVMTARETFPDDSYLPVNGDLPVCPDHPGHAMLTYSDGKQRCTSNAHLPDVAEHNDRIREALQREMDR